ncbi:MAG: response regulator transcription factor [Sphingobacteriales bacterium]|nr:MAG: response regulator transcription factor [Sphingobacteriales bacterium]
MYPECTADSGLKYTITHPMINCLIVDDEQHSIDVLTYHIKRLPYLNLVGARYDATSAITAVNEMKIDLLFQDIHLPDMSGLEVVEIIRGKCEVILTTAYSNYALEGFDLGVSDYLLKPISYPRFLAAVQKILDRSRQKPLAEMPIHHEHDFIYVRTGSRNNVSKIMLSAIEYIESVKNYIAIYHDGDRTLIYSSMKEIETSLPANRFIRVHRSYIVSLSRIERIEGNNIALRHSSITIPLGESYRGHFWQKVGDKTIGH